MNFSPPFRNPPVGPRVTKSLLTPFGVEVRKLRLERGMRLADLAEKLDYSPSYISAFETGRRNVPDEVIDKLGTLFKLSEFEVAKLRQALASSRTEVVLQPNSPERLALALEIEKKLNSLSTDRIRELLTRVEKFFHTLEHACRIDFEVKKKSRKQISKRASQVRGAFVCEKSSEDDRKKFPIDKFIELLLPLELPDFTFMVTPDHEMNGIAGQACLSPPFIEVSSSVYRQAVEGKPRGRWILAHELGHLMLAHEKGLRGPSILSTKRLSRTASAEWQADEFAGELLMPENACSKLTAEEIAEVFGVSEHVAKDRLSFISKHKLSIMDI